MTKEELIRRCFLLHEKLLYSCFSLYDSLHRFGEEFDNMKHCVAYEKACNYLHSKIDKMEDEG